MICFFIGKQGYNNLLCIKSETKDGWRNNCINCHGLRYNLNMKKKGLAGLIRQWRDHITWVLKLDLWILEGREKHSGKELVIAYAGFEAHKNYLARIAFREGWQEHYLERKWLWRIRSFVRRQNPECALLIYEINKNKERFFTPSRLLRSPVWVRFELPLDESLLSSKARTKHKEIRRKIQKHGFTCSTSKSEADFDDFYHNMYLPLAKQRHAELSVVDDFQLFKKKFLADCELTFVHKNGETIAGGILDCSEPIYYFLSMGIRNGSREYVKMGVSEALYYFRILRSREKGCKIANLGHCRSFFKDGVFRHKLEMGAYVANEYHKPEGCLYFRFLRDTEGLREFLCENPFVALGKDKICHGIVFVQEPLASEELDQALKIRDCEGLRDVFVYTFNHKKVGSVQTAGGYHAHFLPTSSVRYPEKKSA